MSGEYDLFLVFMCFLELNAEPNCLICKVSFVKA